MPARVNSTALLKNHKARARPAARSAARRQPEQLDLFGAPRTTVRPPINPMRLVAIALRIWSASRPVAGTLGENFFVARRLPVPDDANVRFHPSLKLGNVRAPDLLFLLRDL